MKKYKVLFRERCDPKCAVEYPLLAQFRIIEAKGLTHARSIVKELMKTYAKKLNKKGFQLDPYGGIKEFIPETVETFESYLEKL